MTKPRAGGRGGHGAVSVARRDRALDELVMTGDVEAAAKAAKVHWRTVYSWLSQDEAFRARYEEMRDQVRAGCVDQAIAGRIVGLRTLIKAARRGHVKAAEVLVKAGETKKVEISGPNGGPMEHADVPLDRKTMLARTRELVAELEAMEADEPSEDASTEGDDDA